MAEVLCYIVHADPDSDAGIERPYIIAECAKCGHQTESKGQGQASITRCLALMREECPMDEQNFYVAE